MPRISVVCSFCSLLCSYPFVAGAQAGATERAANPIEAHAVSTTPAPPSSSTGPQSQASAASSGDASSSPQQQPARDTRDVSSRPGSFGAMAPPPAAAPALPAAPAPAASAAQAEAPTTSSADHPPQGGAAANDTAAAPSLPNREANAEAPQPELHSEPADCLGFRVDGFVQAQYEANQSSEDQLAPGGTPLNRDHFVVRRARLRIDRDFDFANLAVELDANTVRGVSAGIRRAEAALLWRNPSSNVPYVKTTLGLIDIPFGAELPLGARARPFGERSVASQALFPGEADLGVSVTGGVSVFRYALAIMNGQPIDDRQPTLAGRDPNSAKDLILRVGVDAQPEPWLSVSGGISLLRGTGFHAGSDATKNTVQWRDINEDSTKSDTELMGVPGSASTPSKNFGRWATGADAQFVLRTSLGWSRLSTEISFASNLDRGLFIADPISSSADTRELGYTIGFVQEITPYAIVGFRSEFYDGNSDLIEYRRGIAYPRNQSVRTQSPLIGLVLPGRARLTVQYDIVSDALARDRRGVPVDLKNNLLTIRLQVSL